MFRKGPLNWKHATVKARWKRSGTRRKNSPDLTSNRVGVCGQTFCRVSCGQMKPSLWWTETPAPSAGRCCVPIPLCCHVIGLCVYHSDRAGPRAAARCTGACLVATTHSMHHATVPPPCHTAAFSPCALWKFWLSRARRTSPSSEPDLSACVITVHGLGVVRRARPPSRGSGMDAHPPPQWPCRDWRAYPLWSH